MESISSDVREAVENVFFNSPFVKHVGVKLHSIAPGRCEATLKLSSPHLQQLGRAHGAAITTLAGQAALGAATSLISVDEYVVSPEFKMNLFKPAFPGKLICKANVIQAGQSLIFVESDVFSCSDGVDQLVAKGSFTFIRSKLQQGT